MKSPIGLWTGLYTPAFHQSILSSTEEATQARAEIDDILDVLR